MRRFVLNRWWIFVLMLLLALASRPTQASVIAQKPVVRYTIQNTNGYGDPDDPMVGPNLKGPATPRNRIGPTVRPGGDGGRFGSVWMWRLRTVLRALPSGYFRF
jgi:hypothetical protein